MTLDPTCEAYLRRGSRCHFAAKHPYHDWTGHLWRLCDVHMRTILRREKQGTGKEKVAEWLRQKAEAASA